MAVGVRKSGNSPREANNCYDGNYPGYSSSSTHDPRGPGPQTRGYEHFSQQKSSPAFQAQAAIAFGVSFVAATAGIVYLPPDIWQRGFLLMTTLFMVSSAFTLAKVIRDRFESARVHQRIAAWKS